MDELFIILTIYIVFKLIVLLIILYLIRWYFLSDITKNQEKLINQVNILSRIIQNNNNNNNN